MKKTLKLAIGVVSLAAVHLSFPLKVSDAQSLPAACASANVTNPQGKPIGFLTGPEFLNNGSMTLQDIRNYLRRDDIKSWYAGDAKTNLIEDTDSTPSKPVFIDFAKAVFEAAANPNKDPNVAIAPRPINPQLILTMIRKESSTLQLRKRPDISGLACVAGCGCVEGTIHTIRSQITCAARSLRNRFDELAACTDTPNKPVWNLNKPTDDTANKTQDGINVTPSNAATVAHFAYNPVAGVEWGGGGRRKVGGVALFCILWHRDMDKRAGKNGFANPPPSLTLSSTNPTLTCTDPLTPISPRTVDYRNVTLSVSGGTPPYTWSSTDTTGTTTKGVISACGQLGEDAVLRPPTNNPDLGGYAGYWKSGRGAVYPTCVNGGVQSLVFNCLDQETGGSNVISCPEPVPQVCVASEPFDQHGSCGFSDRCEVGGTNTYVRIRGGICNQRTAEAISLGCRPCRLEMQGATVTVTDDAGASTNATMTVQ